MASVGDELYLDRAKATVSDELELTEGSGEDEQETTLHVLSVEQPGRGAVEYLLRLPDAEGTAPLYRRLPRAEAPQDEAPQDEAPQDEAPQDEAPQDEAPQDEAPQDEAPQDAAPQDEAPQDEAPQDEAQWRGERELTAKSKAKRAELTGALTLRESTAEGGQLLRLGETTWRFEDHVVRYGEGDKWLARSTTPASALRTHEVEHVERGSARGAIISYAAVALLMALGVADLAGWLGWFSTVYPIAGVLTMLVSLAPFARGSLLVAASFSLWVLTRTFAPTVLAAIPGVAELVGGAGGLPPDRAFVVWALALILAVLPLHLLARKAFFVLGDGAVWATLLTVVLYTVGLGLVAWLDEDFGLFDSWAAHYRASPWCYLWLATLVGFLIYLYRDYRRVPMHGRGFAALRDRVARQLEGEHPWRQCKSIGDGLDDLGDAMRIASDHDVRQLHGHQAGVQRIAKAFRALAEQGGGRSIRNIAERAAPLRADLRQLAAELRRLENGGRATRPSPLLLFIAAGDPGGLVPEP